MNGAIRKLATIRDALKDSRQGSSSAIRFSVAAVPFTSGDDEGADDAVGSPMGYWSDLVSETDSPVVLAADSHRLDELGATLTVCLHGDGDEHGARVINSWGRILDVLDQTHELGWLYADPAMARLTDWLAGRPIWLGLLVVLAAGDWQGLAVDAEKDGLFLCVDTFDGWYGGGTTLPGSQFGTILGDAVDATVSVLDVLIDMESSPTESRREYGRHREACRKRFDLLMMALRNAIALKGIAERDETVSERMKPGQAEEGIDHALKRLKDYKEYAREIGCVPSTALRYINEFLNHPDVAILVPSKDDLRGGRRAVVDRLADKSLRVDYAVEDPEIE